MDKTKKYKKKITRLTRRICKSKKLDMAEVLIILDYMCYCSDAGMQTFSEKSQRQLRRILR